MEAANRGAREAADWASDATSSSAGAAAESVPRSRGELQTTSLSQGHPGEILQRLRAHAGRVRDA
jgi:hypothetical protein